MGKSPDQKMQVTEYSMSIHFGLCVECDAVLEIEIAEKSAWKGNQAQQGPININRPDLFGGVKKEGGVKGTAYFLPGHANQVLPTGLAQRLGASSGSAPAYRGVASLWFVGSMSAGYNGGGGGGGGSVWYPSDDLNGGGGGFNTWTPPGGGFTTPVPPDYGDYLEDAIDTGG